MPEKDVFGERGRAIEEEYFRRKDRELIERMRSAARDEEARKQLEAKTGLGDPVLLAELQALGFTPDTVSLLPLVPLIQVAWAEGGVTEAERSALIKLARARGIAEKSAADGLLSNWLDTPPDPEIFVGAMRLIAAMLDAQGGGLGDLKVDDLVRHCEDIAQASGGIFGFIGRVSADERQLLRSIADGLKGRR